MWIDLHTETPVIPFNSPEKFQSWQWYKDAILAAAAAKAKAARQMAAPHLVGDTILSPRWGKIGSFYRESRGGVLAFGFHTTRHFELPANLPSKVVVTQDCVALEFDESGYGRTMVYPDGRVEFAASTVKIWVMTGQVFLRRMATGFEWEGRDQGILPEIPIGFRTFDRKISVGNYEDHLEKSGIPYFENDEDVYVLI
jgi:hypothetical protein